jgi:hypothetical protein
MQRCCLAIGLISALGFWAGGCQEASSPPSRVGPPVLSAGPDLSLEDAGLLPIPNKHRITAWAIALDSSQLFVSLDDHEGTITLGTVALTPGGKFQRWGTLPECLDVFSVAWAPSGEETVALVARLERGDPAVFETSVLTWTKGEEPTQRHTLSQERNPSNKGGEKIRMAWPRSDAVCLLQRDGLYLLTLASGESSCLYERDKSVSVIAALRSDKEGVLEFIQYPFESLLDPEKVQPTQLVRLGLDGKVLGTTKLAAGVGAGLPLLSDVNYAYGGENPAVKAPSELHSLRLFDRDTNRLVYRLPSDWGAVGAARVDRGVLVFAVALGRDGRRMVCRVARGLTMAASEEKGQETVLFELAPP